MEDDFGEFYFGAISLVEAEIIEEEVDMVGLEEVPQMGEALLEVGSKVNRLTRCYIF